MRSAILALIVATVLLSIMSSMRKQLRIEREKSEALARQVAHLELEKTAIVEECGEPWINSQ